MTHVEHTIWQATTNGNYPPGTTAQQVANFRGPNGFSALHQAVSNGHLPPGTTSKLLATTKNHFGWSALHIAATSGQLPPNISPQTLANTTDNEGRSALHEAAAAGHLPANTSAALLKETQQQSNESAWDALTTHLLRHPEKILELPHQLFADDHSLAIGIVNSATKLDPTLRSPSALWLGKVFAEDQPTNQATPRRTPSSA